MTTAKPPTHNKNGKLRKRYTRRKRKRGTDRKPAAGTDDYGAYLPTPKQIASAAAEIRASWSPAVMSGRLDGLTFGAVSQATHRQAWTPPVVSLDALQMLPEVSHPL